ncbi:MAG TPA: EamA family transporter [Acidimicrobiia bacterium]|nr:EamA family transporter [Acidimicrobiia bacterium]
MSLVFALLASLTYGAADFLGGFIGRRVPILAVVLWSQAVGLIMAILAALLFPADTVGLIDFIWGSVGGLAGTMGLFFLYKGLAEGRMAVVSPVTALVGAAVPIGIGLVIGERPGPSDWIGIALAMPAIWLVAGAPAQEIEIKGGARYGVFAGVGFGLFFAAIAQTGVGSGLWPLVGARVAQVAMVATVAAVKDIGLPPAGSRLALVVLGLGDILANVFLLLAFRSGMLTIVSVLASLYPAITVLLAVIVLKEPIHRRQLTGLALTLLAVSLIAV